MLKKLSKGLIVTGLCATLLVPTFSYANEVDEEPTTPIETRVETFSSEIRDGFKGKLENRKENMQDRAEMVKDKGSRILNVIEEYAPDMVDKFESAFEQLKDLSAANKEARKEALQDIMEPIKAEFTVFREDIHEKVESGEMTGEEARSALQAFREEQKAKLEALREQYKSESTNEKAAEKEAHKQIREDLKAAVENGDEAAIVDLLNQIYDNLLDRIASLQQ